MPVTKMPIPDTLEDEFSATGHQHHILFAGTTVLQTKSTGERHVRAVVLRTGACLRRRLPPNLPQPPPQPIVFVSVLYSTRVCCCVAAQAS